MENGNSYQPSQPSSLASLSRSWYQSIYDLPLSRFAEVSTTGNVFALVISGQPTVDELLEAWASITEEYTIAIGNQEQILQLRLFKEIQKLASSIEQIEIVIPILEKVYVPFFADRLNSLLNQCLPFDVNKPEEYDSFLKRCRSLAKRQQLSLQMKLAQYEAGQRKEAGDAVASKEYFQSTLLTLGQADNTFYEADKLTVFMFCELIKRLNKRIQAQETK